MVKQTGMSPVFVDKGEVMYCMSKQAQQHANAPHYATWAPPQPPRLPIWLAIAILMMLANLAITLMHFALSAQSAFSSSRFWLYALLPGLLLAGLVFGLRLTWHALASMYVCRNTGIQPANPLHLVAVRTPRNCRGTAQPALGTILQ